MAQASHQHPSDDGHRVPSPTSGLWQWASGIRGHLSLHQTLGHDQTRPGLLTGSAERVRTGLGLVLGGHITREVLDWYEHPTSATLARVRAVEASTVQSLDETGRALLFAVYLATSREGRRVPISPSGAVTAVLARHGGLGLFDPASRHRPPHPRRRGPGRARRPRCRSSSAGSGWRARGRRRRRPGRRAPRRAAPPFARSRRPGWRARTGRRRRGRRACGRRGRRLGRRAGAARQRRGRRR